MSNPSNVICATCNEEHATPFCPQCGGKLDAEPLVSLLWHCERQAGAFDERRKGYTDPDKAVLLVAKWRGWCTRLREVLAQLYPGSEPDYPNERSEKTNVD